MAERTIRKRRGAGSVTLIAVPQPVGSDGTEIGDDGEPVTVEPNGTVEPATIDDYDLGAGSNGDGQEFVDPAAGSDSGTGDGRKRRPRSDAGTRRGSRRGRASATETTNSVANMLFSLHMGMSMFLHSEVLSITEDESAQLAKALTNVTQLYDIPVIGEKALAWTNLAMVAGKVYGPRYVASRINKKSKPSKVVTTFEQPIVINETRQG
jgi:hypothetical protein